MNPFSRCLLKYYCIISSFSCDIPYSGLNFGIIPGLSSILKSCLSWCGGSWSTNHFSNLLIRLWYSLGIRSQGSTYCFGFSAFLISSIIIAKISWSYFLANKMQGTAYITRILRGFNVSSSHSLLRLVVITLLYWFKVYSKGNSYYIKFK